MLGRIVLTLFHLQHILGVALVCFRDRMAVRRPEAKKMNVGELIDNRFVKELEDGGFVKSLYGGK